MRSFPFFSALTLLHLTGALSIASAAEKSLPDPQQATHAPAHRNDGAQTETPSLLSGKKLSGPVKVRFQLNSKAHYIGNSTTTIPVSDKALAAQLHSIGVDTSAGNYVQKATWGMAWNPKLSGFDPVQGANPSFAYVDEALEFFQTGDSEHRGAVVCVDGSRVQQTFNSHQEYAGTTSTPRQAWNFEYVPTPLGSQWMMMPETQYENRANYVTRVTTSNASDEPVVPLDPFKMPAEIGVGDRIAVKLMEGVTAIWKITELKERDDTPYIAGTLKEGLDSPVRVSGSLVLRADVGIVEKCSMTFSYKSGHLAGHATGPWTASLLFRRCSAEEYASLAAPLRTVNALAEEADKLEKQGSHDQAESLYRKALAVRPNFARANGALGDILVNAQKPKEAEPFLRASLAQNPDDATRLNKLGVILYDDKRYADAEVNFRKANLLLPTDAIIQNNLGEALGRQDKWKEAEQTFRRAAKLDATNARTQDDLGDALIAQKKYGEAEQYYRQAVQIAPDNVSYKTDLGDDLLKQWKLDEARAIYESAFRLKPDTVLLEQGLGRCLMRMENFAFAETYLRQALELKPNNAVYQSSLGVDLYFAGRLAEAEPLLKAVADVQKDVGITQADAYNVLIDQGKEKEAAPYLAAATKLMPGKTTYRWEHNYFTRVAFWLDPADGASQNAVGNLLVKKGKLSQAAIFLKAAVKADSKNENYANDLAKCIEALKQ